MVMAKPPAGTGTRAGLTSRGALTPTKLWIHRYMPPMNRGRIRLLVRHLTDVTTSAGRPQLPWIGGDMQATYGPNARAALAKASVRPLPRVCSDLLINTGW